MKYLRKAIPFLAIPLVISCSVAKKSSNATVIRDCTGTYLRMDSKDYLVCNATVLKDVKTGSAVNAVFSKTDKCPELEGVMVCMMYHKNEGTIRIDSFK